MLLFLKNKYYPNNRNLCLGSWRVSLCSEEHALNFSRIFPTKYGLGSCTRKCSVRLRCSLCFIFIKAFREKPDITNSFTSACNGNKYRIVFAKMTPRNILKRINASSSSFSNFTADAKVDVSGLFGSSKMCMKPHNLSKIIKMIMLV